MFHCKYCHKEFTNKSNFNRHVKSCMPPEPSEPSVMAQLDSVYYNRKPSEPSEGVQVAPEPSEPDGKISEAQGDTVQNNEPTDLTPDYGGDQPTVIDLDKLPPNSELDVNFSLCSGERVFFDHVDESDGNYVWIKVDSWSTGRRVLKIHVDTIRSAMMPE